MKYIFETEYNWNCIIPLKRKSSSTLYTTSMQQSYTKLRFAFKRIVKTYKKYALQNKSTALFYILRQEHNLLLYTQNNLTYQYKVDTNLDISSLKHQYGVDFIIP